MPFADQVMLMAILAHEAAMGNATKVAAQILRHDQLDALGMRKRTEHDCWCSGGVSTLRLPLPWR
jgi:hypothetical protein